MRNIIGAVLAIGLLAGCGGVETGMDEQSTLATREDKLPWCGDSQYDIRYYSEPELINQVGRTLCLCGTYERNFGNQTPYYRIMFEDYCI